MSFSAHGHKQFQTLRQMSILTFTQLLNILFTCLPCFFLQFTGVCDNLIEIYVQERGHTFTNFYEILLH